MHGDESFKILGFVCILAQATRNAILTFSAPHYTAIRGLSGYTVFFPIIP
jgi:hypothetical protein